LPAAAPKPEGAFGGLVCAGFDWDLKPEKLGALPFVVVEVAENGLAAAAGFANGLWVG